MLSPATVEALRQPAARRTTAFAPGVLLRIALGVGAVFYVLGPTLAQWVSFAPAREEVAALRIADPPETIGPAQVTEMIEDVGGLLGPGISAFGAIRDRTGGFGTTIFDAVSRALQVTVVFLVLFVVSMRSTVRYRPRHGAGLSAALLARRG